MFDDSDDVSNCDSDEETPLHNNNNNKASKTSAVWFPTYATFYSYLISCIFIKKK